MGEQPKDPRDIIDGEIVAEYNDTMLNLPAVDPEADTGPHSPVSADPSRRDFLLRLALGGAAAAALGGSAALIAEQRRQSAGRVRHIVLPNGAEVNPEDSGRILEQLGQAQAALATLTADRDRVQQELDEALAALETARTEADAASTRLAEVENVNGMWQQLDNTGLDNLVFISMGLVAGTLADVLGVVSLLRDGLALGQERVEDFLNALPGPRDGLRWLQRQVTVLAGRLDQLVEQVGEAIEQVAPLTTALGEFVLWVLERLPFGMGSRARAGLEGMRTLISDLPAMVAGINEDVLDPLGDWFGSDESQSLAGVLVAPIVEQVFGPARDLLDRIAAHQETFEQEFAEPVQTALDEREVLRNEIHEAQARLGRVA